MIIDDGKITKIAKGEDSLGATVELLFHARLRLSFC